jgi:hypothetical protein
MFKMLPSTVEIKIPKAMTANTTHLLSTFTRFILSPGRD